MINFSTFHNSFNNPENITSISLYPLTYTDDIWDFTDSAIKKFKDIEINIYFNINSFFKEFVYKKDIFNKLIQLNSLANLFFTDSSNKILIINNDMKNIYNLNTLSHVNSNSIEFNKLTNFSFNIDKFATLYIKYILSKQELYDFEFEYYYNKLNNISLNPANIPQFSNFEHASKTSTYIINKFKKEGVSFIDLGNELKPTSEKTTAKQKYGENHGKFSYLLDFSYSLKSGKKLFFPTPLGNEFLKLNDFEQEKLIKFQLFKLDLVQTIISKKIESEDEILDVLAHYLAPSTCKRRLSNVKTIINYLEINKKM